MSQLSLKKRLGETLSFVIPLLVAIASIIAGTLVGGSSYIVVSFIVVFCAIVPFVISFERRNPSARMVAFIAVTCSLAIASRVVFIWLPFFKPMAAIIMVGGIAFGRRSGFLIGALTMLASNVIFGQGPWTPWQMLSFGLCGYFFGMLADAGIFARSGMSWGKRLGLAVSGALFIICIAGPILDTSSLFYVFSRISLETAIAVYAAGLIPNCIQAAATFITLLLVADPMLSMIDRLRSKYGV